MKLKIKNLIENTLRNDRMKKSFLKHRHYNYLSGSYIYPHESNDIYEKLLGEEDFTDTKDYLFSKDISFFKDYVRYSKLLNNDSLNPRRKYLLSNYYIKPENFNSYDRIYDFCEDDEYKCTILHIGEKGSGKTAMQNIWLHENNKKLEDNKIFWVRCDSHKLYQLWLDYARKFDNKDQTNLFKNERDNSITIEEQKLVNLDNYIDIQLLYVLCKNFRLYGHDSNDFFVKIVYLIKNADISIELPNSRNYSSKTIKVSLYK